MSDAMASPKYLKYLGNGMFEKSEWAVIPANNALGTRGPRAPLSSFEGK